MAKFLDIIKICNAIIPIFFKFMTVLSNGTYAVYNCKCTVCHKGIKSKSYSNNLFLVVSRHIVKTGKNLLVSRFCLCILN